MSDHERSTDDASLDAVTPPEGHEDLAEYAGAVYPAEAYVPPPRRRRRRHLVALQGGRPDTGDDDALARARPKIKWLRLIALISGLGLLATVSTIFGMMMAVASDLPRLDVLDVSDRPSFMFARDGSTELGTLTGNQRRILIQGNQIAPVMKQALISIEDKRFYEHEGVDLRGIVRALYEDVVAKKVVQGGSTITQQLVKNRLEAQNDRTLFQKLREAAIAFHMTRKWDKDKILKNYLNTIYFGNGAYGIESAARAYFGSAHGYGLPTGCGARGQPLCAERLEPHEAAMLAGVISSPSAYDPIAHPVAAKARRDLVLQRMLEQGFLTRPQRDLAVAEPVPNQADINPPQEASTYPYFTTWVRQHVVDLVGGPAAFEGGLRVRTTIDPAMQKAAEESVSNWLGENRAPAAAMVVLDNRTSEVLAMVGGPLADEAFAERPFNLATQGQRQPGSAFKPFVLAEALRQGVSPGATFSSKKKHFCVTRRKGKCREWFEVNNYEDRYSGVTTLANATAFSDNSVYAELGIRVGLRKISRLARRMGIRTKVSANPAMTLGGLAEGVTVLDMAHAYQVFARGGELPYGTLSPGADAPTPGPVGVREIRKLENPDDPGDRSTVLAETLERDDARNERRSKRVFSKKAADLASNLLAGVVKVGTGKRAALGNVPVFGKTGTTEDYGDAWFVGWTAPYTVAVWVGFPDTLKPMKPPLFSFQGEPVAGGTYPAAIWQTFMKKALEIYKARHPEKKLGPSGPTGPATPVQAPPPTSVAPAGEGGGGGTTTKPPPAQEQEPAPAPEQPEQPAPETPPATEPETPPAQPPPAGEGGAAPPGDQ